MNIANALMAGYSIAQALGFLTNNFPNIGKRIKDAQKLGYDVNQIIKTFSNMSIDDLESFENSQEIKTKNPWIDSDKVQQERSASSQIKKNLPKIAGLVAAPLAAYGVYRALKGGFPSPPSQNIPQLPGGMPPGPNSPGVTVLNTPTSPPMPGSPVNPPPVVPQSPGQMATPATPMPQGITPGQQIQQNVQAPLNSALNAVGGEQISQASQAIPDQPITPPIPLFEQLMNGVDIESLDEGTQQQLRFLSMISDQLESQGKTLDDVQFKNLKKKIDKLLEGKGGVVLEEVSRRLPKPEINPTTIEKSSIVSTPSGVGEVKSISGDNAIVDIDGKAHKIKSSEIEPSIFTDDDVADAYDHIIKVIPEAHRSGFIQWAGYDEDRNVLGFIPRGGKYEELHNITPEEAKMIKEGKGVARTSGENKEGLWVTGEDTRGGVISQIIWDRKKKEDSLFSEATGLPTQKKKRSTEKDTKGMQPIFDEMGYAREKSREREKANKLAEKLRKQKEKDEAKKRKKQA